MVRSRKLEAAILGIKLGALLLVAVGCLSVFHTVTDAMEDRDHYRALFQIEQQSTQLLIDHQFDSMTGKYDSGTDIINVEIPCTVDKGVVHQVMYKVVK